MTHFSEDDLRKKGLIKGADGNYSSYLKKVKLCDAFENVDLYKKTGMMLMPASIVLNKIVFDINPMGAVRMTKRDKYFLDPNHPDPKKRQRPAVTRYFLYKRNLQVQAKGYSFTLPESGIHITAYLEMPKSWSKKKKEAMNGQPHRSRPDADNILKGIQDALCKEDGYIWDVRITKKWANHGSIEIQVNQNR
jgi:Holliday junction resolvase RusA-like endonuclease